MPQVIEWVTLGPDDVVWRCPVEDITWGAQLVVHEFETAVFLRDGKAYDGFGPGLHTLTVQNLPLLVSAFRLVIGSAPFKSIVIFLATRQFAGRWGAKAQTTEMAPLLVHGTFLSRITEPTLFVNKVVGAQ